MRTRPRFFKPPHAALGALAATLLLGMAGPALPGVAALLPWGAFGLALVTGAGLLAWHLARLTAVPTGQAGLAGAALPAALLPILALPSIGTAALAVPALLAAAALRRGPVQRVVALLVQCGAAAALTAVPGDLFAACFVTGTMLAAAWISLRSIEPRAANDNPSMERAPGFWLLPVSVTYARENPRDSLSGIGE